MKQRTLSLLLFWAVLLGFFAWDWSHSEPVNLRLEADIIALGSGKAPTGGHCSAF